MKDGWEEVALVGIVGEAEVEVLEEGWKVGGGCL